MNNSVELDRFLSLPDVSGPPERAGLPALSDLRHVPDSPQVHGLRLVLGGLFVGERVLEPLEKRVLPPTDRRG